MLPSKNARRDDSVRDRYMRIPGDLPQETIPVKLQRPFQVADTQSDQGNSWLHWRSLRPLVVCSAGAGASYPLHPPRRVLRTRWYHTPLDGVAVGSRTVGSRLAVSVVVS